jgi:predicted secreted acid phosphatase
MRKRKKRFKEETLYVKYNNNCVMTLKKEIDPETGKKYYRIIDIDALN